MPRAIDESNYYYGKICLKHPEEKGKRTISRRTCIACNRETVLRCRKKGSLNDKSGK